MRGSDMRLIHGMYESIGGQTCLGHRVIVVVEKVGAAVDRLMSGRLSHPYQVPRRLSHCAKAGCESSPEDTRHQTVGLCFIAVSSQALQGLFRIP